RPPNALGRGIGETTTYLLGGHSREHCRRIRTNNMIERLNREIRRHTRVAGSFPDGQSALMPVTAGTGYVTSRQWSTRRYLDMYRLGDTMNTSN
ncbi:transposase, partial [uncultured Bifidobacterium sp.]|uniref:transposase n=1 Tax=uncultured Bifidobacterium sp. TaxID=165187 RepID=UPI002632B5FE